MRPSGRGLGYSAGLMVTSAASAVPAFGVRGRAQPRVRAVGPCESGECVLTLFELFFGRAGSARIRLENLGRIWPDQSGY
jgi:hypothetical protein